MNRGMLPIDDMTHAELYALRARPDAMHDWLAPAEHRAFAREFAQEQPLRAAVSLPFAIPAYTAAKATGMIKARSPASWDEIFAGYRGLLEGLLRRR